MSPDIFSRIRMLVGPEGFGRLQDARVVIVGFGAVGSFAAEALVRSGVGHIRLIDADCYDPSNVNRQLGATSATTGEPKVDVGRAHLLEVNPSLDVEVCRAFVGFDTLGLVTRPFGSNGMRPVYLIDAIDTIDPKVMLLAGGVGHGLKVFSSMGAARKTDPGAVRCGDISETEVCPLAREVRKRLRKLGIPSGVTCVYSVEPPAGNTHAAHDPASGAVVRRPTLGSCVTVTGTFGLRLASECMSAILG